MLLSTAPELLDEDEDEAEDDDLELDDDVVVAACERTRHKLIATTSASLFIYISLFI